MRATRAVQVLLRVLPMQPEGGWTHPLVETALQQQGVQVNRVTVYRALDRLTEAGLLQQTVDGQRITRYWVRNHPAMGAAVSAQMACKSCHEPMALDGSAAALQAALQALRQAVSQTTGVLNPIVNVAVQGECAHCIGA